MSTTIQEQQFNRAAKNWLKAGRRTSYILNHQSGFNDVMGTKQFDVGNAPVDTQRVDQDDIGDSDFDGSVPMEGSNDDSPIYGAIDILQKHIESLGNADLLNIWASTSDALKKTVTSGMQKGVPNPDGNTRPPLHVGDNTAASNAGPQKYISVADLENAARKQTQLTSRIVHAAKL